MMTASRAKRLFVAAAILVIIGTAILSIFFPYSKDPDAHLVFYKKLPGFAAMLGLLGSLLMITVVKTVAKKFLQRPEDYYSAFEERLSRMAGHPPGPSRADPNAPSEELEEITARDGGTVRKEGSNG